MSVTLPTIRFEQLKEKAYQFIDVRTPAEFAEFHIPGAVNEPIFTNEERKRVGTVYKQIGQDKAKEIGIDLLSEKLPGIYKRLKQIYTEKQKPLCIYCWRGGMRSKSIVSIVSLMGVECCQLEGGIRSYRYRIMSDFENYLENPKVFIVLEGHTGTKKTEFLTKLQAEGFPVLDLEGFAGHRGSVFGAIGLEPNSQKRFDSLLWERIQELQDTPYYFIEAESKRIGRISLPEFIEQGKRKSIRINLNCPFHERIRTIYQTYEPEEHHDEIEKAIQKIIKRIPEAFQEEIKSGLQEKDYTKVFSVLLENYYDPRYTHKMGEYENEINYDIFFQNFSDGLKKIKQALLDITRNQFDQKKFNKSYHRE